VLAGGQGWTLSTAAASLAATSRSTTVWLSEREVAGRRLPVSHGERLLGSELDNLVYDAYSGFDPDSFGAALGAIRGGGLLLLLTPELESWPQCPDPQAARIAVHPFTAGQVKTRFFRRLARIVASSPGVSVVSESEPIPLSLPSGHRSANPVLEIKGECRTPDQQRAVAAILKTAGGRARRPLILTSDRGRGKSSALGIAAARILEIGRRRILVTAPRRSAVEPLFLHTSRLLPDASVQANRIGYLDALLEFLPPDDLCRFRRQSDLLLVDEAAGIPASLLVQLLNAYPRVVFATTVHGYEGTGRGFEIRFRQTLDVLTPEWRGMRLDTPIRWAPDDPLEQLASSVLQLDAAPADGSLFGSACPQTSLFRRLDRDVLANDETTLSRLFGLLVLAHYQTRPMDLRHLLDGPNLRVYALFHKEQVVATAVVAIEGRFAADLARAVFLGRRRPRGHLLPQTLSAHAGIEEASKLGYARVIRIAVHPAVQGRGLGRSLLDGIVGDIQAQNLDLIGSSFGATTNLLDFWERCGYPPVHLGARRNAASGAHAAVVLRPLSPAGDSLQTLALARLGQRLPRLLAEPLQDLETEIAASLIRNTPEDTWNPDPRELRELEAFAFALRSYESILPLLAGLAFSRLGQALVAGKVDNRERAALIGKVFQHRDWATVAQTLSLSGKAQVVELLRRVVGKLI